MTAAVWLLAGLAFGVGVEQVYHRRSGRVLPPPEAPGLPGGAGEPPQPSGRRRRWPKVVAIVVVLLLVLVPIGAVLWANHQFSKIARVDVGSALSPAGNGTNYLLVGSDGRPGLDGSRSDTVIVLHADKHGTKMLSIPRDLYVPIAGTGHRAKINSAYPIGPTTLINTVHQQLGIPITRYVEINYVAFPKLVDALGGITINFPYPAYDTHSGLNVPQAGPVHLNGQQALAYVRSRYYTQVINGKPQTDPTADLGREKRQQEFLRAVFHRLSSTRNPVTLDRALGDMSDGLRIDNKMSLIDAFYFSWRLKHLDTNTVTLPTVPKVIGGSDVLMLGPGADVVLNQFR